MGLVFKLLPGCCCFQTVSSLLSDDEQQQLLSNTLSSAVRPEWSIEWLARVTSSSLNSLITSSKAEK
jgi:hypothetical protein